MIDPLLALALSMQSSPGVYALLLGSGVSRSAEIPTGWEVVLDLIRKLAAIDGDDAEPDPEAWYTAKYGHQPTYSGLLSAVGKSQAERSQLLRGYFEPSEEDRESGKKLPTAAHKAVAELVSLGIVRVIITTNFDRLIEQALRSEGIEPTVVASANDIAGMTPLAHEDCVVIKLHGDYRDLRTRNTPIELDEYEPDVDALLDRVIDEYGLVICGWSGEWDTALRNAISRAPNRRFTTYWTTLSDLSDAGQQLVAHRSAEVITISGADEFFGNLAEKVRTLYELQSPHPLTVKAAVAQTKRHLADPNGQIRLSDLLMGEVERVIEETNNEHFPVQASFDEDEGIRRMRQFESICSIAASIIGTGCFWGKPGHRDVWVRAINRLLNRDGERQGTTLFLGMQFYPAMILQYAAGIAAAAAGSLVTVFEILNRPKLIANDVYRFTPLELQSQVRHALFEVLPDTNGGVFSRSEHMHDFLRLLLKDIVPSDAAYTIAFDTFETLQAVEMLSRNGQSMPATFMWRYYSVRNGSRVARQDGSPLLKFDEDVTREGASAPFIQAGFMGGSAAKWPSIMKQLDQMSDRAEWGFR